MAKEKRNLKKLNNCEKQAISGGTIFYGRGQNGCYFVPDPINNAVYKHHNKDRAVKSAISHGISTDIINCKTEVAALEAAQKAAGILQPSLAEATNLDGFLAHFS